MVSDENGAKFTIFRLTVVFLEEAIRRKRFTLEPLYVSSEPLKAEVQNLISIVDDGFDHQRFDPQSAFRNLPDRDYRCTYTFEAKDMCFRINFPSRRKKSRVEGEIAIGACYVFIADRSAVCMVSLVSRHYWISRA